MKDKLTKRVRRMEDQHRRDMIRLRRETVDLVMTLLHDDVAILSEEQVLRRLRGQA